MFGVHDIMHPLCCQESAMIVRTHSRSFCLFVSDRHKMHRRKLSFLAARSALKRDSKLWVLVQNHLHANPKAQSFFNSDFVNFWHKIM